MRVWFVVAFVAIFGIKINAQDAINLGDVEVCDGHREMLAWPATATITKLIVQPTDTFIEHTKTPDGWPEVTPPGWQDPLQYTLWPIYLVNGRWMTAGSIQFWKFRNGTGSPLHSLAADWLPPGCPRVQPVPGQQIGFFVTAGNQRISDDHVMMERSNVVLITYPAGENQVFTFATSPPPVVTPPPVIVVPPVVTPPHPLDPPVPPVVVPPPLDLSGVTQLLQAIQKDVAEHRVESQRIYKGALKFIVERVAPVVGGIVATWQMTKK